MHVVQASIQANTYVVSGPSQVKKLQDLLPGIIQQLGPDNLANLRKIAMQYSNSVSGLGKDAIASREGDGEEDDVPDLVENFDQASE